MASLKINWKNFTNEKVIKKMFKSAIAELLRKELIFEWDFATVELVLKQFDSLITTAKEKIKFEMEDKQKLIDDLISIKEKGIIESNSLEVDSVPAVRFRTEMREEIAALKASRFYSTFNIDRKGVIRTNPFEQYLTNKIDACERILKSSGLLPATKLKLMQLGGIQDGGQTLQDFLKDFAATEESDEFTVAKSS